MSHLVLSVPESVTSHYVIATNEPPEDPRTAVPWRVPEVFRAAAMEAIGTPQLSIFTIRADEATWRLDGILASDDDKRRIRESSHQIVLAHRQGTAGQPRAEQTARAVARAIADVSDGVLIDPQARHVILRDGLARTERGWFRMGDQWFGTRYEVDETAARLDPIGDARTTAQCSCLRITLLGMRRFGLPDLTMNGVACAHDLPALNLLRALAHRLLTDQWEWTRRRPSQRIRPVDDHPKIDPNDFWAYWGATPHTPSSPLTVRLALTSPTTLEVGPPADYPGSRTEWGREALVPSMPSLIGCPADEDTRRVRSVGSEV